MSLCKLRALLLPLVLLGALPFNSRASLVIYETGFEAPSYIVNAQIHNQDNWEAQFGRIGGLITAAQPKTGSQSLQVNPGALPFPFGVYRHQADNFAAAVSGLPVVSVGVHMRLDGPQTSPPIDGDLISAGLSASIGLDASDGTFQLILSSDGFAYGFGSQAGEDYLFQTHAQLGAYHRVGLQIDFSAGLTRYYLDDTVLGAVAFAADVAPSTTFSRGELTVVGASAAAGYHPANYAAYFDNYSVLANPVPEPAAWLLLGVGIVSIMALCGHRPEKSTRESGVTLQRRSRYSSMLSTS